MHVIPNWTLTGSTDVLVSLSRRYSATFGHKPRYIDLAHQKNVNQLKLEDFQSAESWVRRTIGRFVKMIG